MKSLNLIGLIVAIIFVGLSFVYSDEIAFINWNNNFNIDRYSDSSYTGQIKLTTEIGIITIIVSLLFSYVFIRNLKIKTSKVISIFGISFSAILLIWDLFMLEAPNRISFNEVSIVWLIYGLMAAGAFGITFKQLWLNEKQLSTESDDILDDLKNFRP